MNKESKILNTLLCCVLMALGLFLAGNGVYRYIDASSLDVHSGFSKMGFMKFIVVGSLLFIIGCILLIISIKKIENKSIEEEKKKKSFDILVLISLICVGIGGVVFAFEIRRLNVETYLLEETKNGLTWPMPNDTL